MYKSGIWQIADEFETVVLFMSRFVNKKFSYYDQIYYFLSLIHLQSILLKFRTTAKLRLVELKRDSHKIQTQHTPRYDASIEM